MARKFAHFEGNMTLEESIAQLPEKERNDPRALFTLKLQHKFHELSAEYCKDRVEGADYIVDYAVPAVAALSIIALFRVGILQEEMKHSVAMFMTAQMACLRGIIEGLEEAEQQNTKNTS